MRILLAVDGSDQSFEAARGLGSLSAAEQLILLHAIDLPRLSYPTLGPNLTTDLSLTVEQAMKEEGERLLERISSILPSHHGPTTKRVQIGSPADTILTIAEEVNAHIIVLGARGLGQIREHVMGSVSHRVLTHATCSTLLVKSPLRHLRHVLLPVESQEDADVAIWFLATKPFHEIPQITVLHVIPYSDPAWPVEALIPESFRKDMLTHAGSLTNQVASQLNTIGYQANGFAMMGAPSACILDKLTTNRIDLIIMRSKNRTNISRFFLGSVSHSVLHHTTCSVILLR